MGSGGSKNTHFDEAQKLFNQREKELLMKVFEKLSVEDSERPGRKVIEFEQFKNHVSWLLPEETAKRFFKEMSRSSREFSRASGVSHKQQVTKEGWFILMFNVLKKSNEEKSRIFFSMIADADCIITSADIEQLLILLLDCYATALKKTEVGSMWKLNTIQNSNERFANMAVKELLSNKPHPSYVDFEEIYIWICKEPLVGLLFEKVLTACIMDPSCIMDGAHHGITEGCDETITHIEYNKSNILVPCKLCVDFSAVKTLLDIPSILAINHHLPAISRHQWRLLFSSKTHGESFQAFIHQLVNQGPTILLVKDTDGYIFGGFASESWLLRSQFQGTNKCFLFSLSPTMAFYQPTEFNKNYMYLNMGMRTMPNGLVSGI